MPNLKLTLGCWNYDRTRALADGSVRPDGIDLDWRSAPQVGQIMERMVRDREFDVSELGFTYYLRSLERQGAPFIAIPVFPNRIFRHAAIFVNRANGIRAPRDLIGRKVGELHRYGHDAGIWAKGILSDDWGVPTDSLIHYVGGMDRPAPPEDWSPVVAPANVRIHHLGPGQLLDAMLERGEIDALFSAWVPPSYARGSPAVGRLFENYEAVERDYFARTGIFPMMHVVVIRAEIHRAHPWVARALVQAFTAAKDQAAKAYRSSETFFGAPYMIPWLPALQERNRALMGDDPWAYGVGPNRAALDTYLRYHWEQGLSQRRWTIDEIFAPETLA